MFTGVQSEAIPNGGKWVEVKIFKSENEVSFFGKTFFNVYWLIQGTTKNERKIFKSYFFIIVRKKKYR